MQAPGMHLSLQHTPYGMQSSLVRDTVRNCSVAISKSNNFSRINCRYRDILNFIQYRIHYVTIVDIVAYYFTFTPIVQAYPLEFQCQALWQNLRLLSASLKSGFVMTTKQQLLTLAVDRGLGGAKPQISNLGLDADQPSIFCCLKLKVMHPERTELHQNSVNCIDN